MTPFMRGFPGAHLSDSEASMWRTDSGAEVLASACSSANSVSLEKGSLKMGGFLGLPFNQ